MSVVIRAVFDHAQREITELDAERTAHLEKASAISRRIGTLQSMLTLAAEHAAAESSSNATDHGT
jgi:predicted GNAT superfamily acetyltransferase